MSIENWRGIQDHLIRDYKMLKFRDYIQVQTIHSQPEKYGKDYSF